VVIDKTEVMKSKMRTKRPEQYECAQEILTSTLNLAKRGIVVHAPCKSGKADIKSAIAEICSEYKKDGVRIFTAPIFLSSFFEKGMIEQHERHIDNGMLVLTLHKGSDTLEANFNRIADHLKKFAANVIPLLFIDEADYGSAKGQKISELLEKVLSVWENVRIACFSATTEETLKMLQQDKNGLWDVVVFRPNENFNQMQAYVDAGLCHDVESFWTDGGKGKLSTQGKRAINLFSRDQPFGIIRHRNQLSLDQLKELEELNVEVIHVNCDSKENSSDFWQKVDFEFIYKHQNEDEDEEPKKYRLIAIKNMLSRSVELKWKKHISFYHDYSTKSRDLVTSVQRLGRFNTYKKPETTLFISENVTEYLLREEEICKNFVNKKQFLEQMIDNIQEFSKEANNEISLRTSVVKTRNIELDILEYDEDCQDLRDAYDTLGVKEFNGNALENLSDRQLEKLTYKSNPAKWEISSRKDLSSVISDIDKLLEGSGKYSSKTHLGSLIRYPSVGEWDRMADDALNTNSKDSRKVYSFLKGYKHKNPNYNGKTLLIHQKNKTNHATLISNDKSMYDRKLTNFHN